MPHKKILDFKEDINPIGVSKRVKNSLRKSIKHIESREQKGIVHLTEYLARLFNITEENIVPGYGFSHIFSGVLEMLKPDVILIPSPISNFYRSFFETTSKSILSYEKSIIDNKYYDTNELEQLIEKSDLIILPNPHNVTGKKLNCDDIEDIVAIADREKKVVLFDECLIEFTDIKSHAQCITSSNYSLILRTFSTYHAMAGLPLGYAIGSVKSIKNIKNVLYPYVVRIPSLSCYAAIVGLKDKGYRKRTLETIKAEKDYIINRLKENEYIKVIDRGCNFILLEIIGDHKSISDGLYRRGISVDIYHEKDGSFLRLPMRKHKLNAYFIKSLIQSLGHNKL